MQDLWVDPALHVYECICVYLGDMFLYFAVNGGALYYVFSRQNIDSGGYMLTQIGNGVCNIVFNNSFCNQAYGAPAGFAILTGTVFIGFNIIQKLYRPAEVASKPLSNRVVEKQEEYTPFYIALVQHGHKELGDLEFCKNLEDAHDITQSLKLATPLQIRSTLIYFSSKESSFHQSDAFKEFMIPIIESARERKIDLDCTDGIWTILSLVCQRIPNDSCTEGQRSVVTALLKEDRNPFERAEEKAPHLIPTMNLEILKLFISHPASSLESYEREGFLERCRQYYPNIYHWLIAEKTGEATNFWK